MGCKEDQIVKDKTVKEILGNPEYLAMSYGGYRHADHSIEPTLDDEGLYIGPKTVTKGNHLLELNTGNYVAVGTFDNYRDAEEYSDALFIKGFYTKFGYISQTKIYYVYIFEHDDLQEAIDTSERFNAIGAQFRENWVLQVK